MKQYITPDYLITQLGMLRTDPRYSHKSLLVVEGPTEVPIFYSNIISKKDCDLRSLSGKSSVIKAIEIAEQRKVKGVLGIIDRDLDFLTEVNPTQANIFYTDYRDLENILINSPALEKIISMYLVPDDIDDTFQIAMDLRNIMTRIGVILGYTQWISKIEGLDLNFKKIELSDFESFIDKTNLNLLMINFIQVLAKYSNGTKVPDPVTLKTKIDNIAKDTHNAWHICRGHDLVKILAVIFDIIVNKDRLRGKYKKFIDPDSFDKDLGLAYEYSFFQNTTLYASIIAWEEINRPFRVLRAS